MESLSDEEYYCQQSWNYLWISKYDGCLLRLNGSDLWLISFQSKSLRKLKNCSSNSF